MSEAFFRSTKHIYNFFPLAWFSSSVLPMIDTVSIVALSGIKSNCISSADTVLLSLSQHHCHHQTQDSHSSSRRDTFAATAMIPQFLLKIWSTILRAHSASIHSHSNLNFQYSPITTRTASNRQPTYRFIQTQNQRQMYMTQREWYKFNTHLSPCCPT